MSRPSWFPKNPWASAVDASEGNADLCEIADAFDQGASAGAKAVIERVEAVAMLNYQAWDVILGRDEWERLKREVEEIGK